MSTARVPADLKPTPIHVFCLTRMVTGYRLLLERREPDRRARSRNAQRKASHGYSLKMGQVLTFWNGTWPFFFSPECPCNPRTRPAYPISAPTRNRRDVAACTVYLPVWP